MEDPVTQAALDHTLQELEDAEREVGHLRRELEQAMKEIAWYKNMEDQRFKADQEAKRYISTITNTANLSNYASGNSIDQPRWPMFNDEQLLGIDTSPRMPQDHLPKKAKAKRSA